MNKFINATAILILTLALISISSAGCVIVDKLGLKTQEDDPQLSEESPPPLKPDHIPSNLFPALLVSQDSCYVYIKPVRGSSYFGPLIKGEEITKISTRGDWVFVWVPRIRTSGWVYHTLVRNSGKMNSDTGGVPKDLLNSVTVITGRANIRKGPATSYKVLFRARKRKELTVVGKRGGWYEVWIPELNETGWIYETIVTWNRKNP